MPVSVKRDPFSKQPIVRGDLSLRTPQARVLAALMPVCPEDPMSEWPLVARSQLGVRAGYTAVSGTITRALNGIRAGSSSGDPHPGLLVRGMVEEVVLDVDGVKEVNYRATALGIRAYQAYLSQRGGVPPAKPSDLCTNTKRGYKAGQYRQGEDRYRGRSASDPTGND